MTTKCAKQFKFAKNVSILEYLLKIVHILVQADKNLNTSLKNKNSIARACRMLNSVTMKSANFASLITIILFANGINGTAVDLMAVSSLPRQVFRTKIHMYFIF